MKTTCQVCGRTIKAATGIIAHHGYRRPYQARWQTFSCEGARYAPYEVSCDRLREVIEMVRTFIVSQEEGLVTLLKNPPQVIQVQEHFGSYGNSRSAEYTMPEGFSSEIRNYRETMPRTYENAYDDKKRGYEQQIRAAKPDLSRMEKRLNEWVAPTIDTSLQEA